MKDIVVFKAWNTNRLLRAENQYLRSLLAQWQANCTGMHGSQNPCGMQPCPWRDRQQALADARANVRAASQNPSTPLPPEPPPRV
jgi:hypothetical protein